MSHLKHPGNFWGRVLFIAGQPHYFGEVRREDRRRSRHVYNHFYRGMTRYHNQHEVDEDGDTYFAVENFDEPAPPVRERKEQSDYLAPLRNFLRANVGRPWAEIHSKLSRQTNRNSTCGDHLWQHLDGYIENQPWRIEQDKDRPRSQYSRHDYYVDDEGIFRRMGKEPEPHYSYKKEKKDQKKADKLMLMAPHHAEATDRVFLYGWNPDPLKSFAWDIRPSTTYSQARIIVHGQTPYWGIPVRLKRNGLKTTGHWVFRSGQRLSKEESDIYWSLCQSVRAAVTYQP